MPKKMANDLWNEFIGSRNFSVILFITTFVPFLKDGTPNIRECDLERVKKSEKVDKKFL
jgi:hypothetical protein